ncbi:hypothetical protein AKJ58_01560, partial [candidate division MSBL1 archaeon SCGC-AAA385D11]
DKEIYGADISDTALNYCRERGISNVYDLEKTEPPKDHFDLITCLDVLEHVHEDVDPSERRSSPMQRR